MCLEKLLNSPQYVALVKIILKVTDHRKFTGHINFSTVAILANLKDYNALSLALN